MQKIRLSLVSEVSAQIKKCLLLSQEEKAYWLLRLDSLPETSLTNLLKIFKEKNAIIEEYLKTALESDPDQKILQSFKDQIKKIKNNALELEHSDEGNKAEEALEKSLKQI